MRRTGTPGQFCLCGCLHYDVWSFWCLVSRLLPHWHALMGHAGQGCVMVDWLQDAGGGVLALGFDSRLSSAHELHYVPSACLSAQHPCVGLAPTSNLLVKWQNRSLLGCLKLSACHGRLRCPSPAQPRRSPPGQGVPGRWPRTCCSRMQAAACALSRAG